MKYRRQQMSYVEPPCIFICHQNTNPLQYVTLNAYQLVYCCIIITIRSAALVIHIKSPQPTSIDNID